jgi:hypothetical protein
MNYAIIRVSKNFVREEHSMSRSEKIGGLILGVVLFAGLFYFIYNSVLKKSPAGSPFAGENTFSDSVDGSLWEDDLDLDTESLESEVVPSEKK